MCKLYHRPVDPTREDVKMFGIAMGLVGLFLPELVLIIMCFKYGHEGLGLWFCVLTIIGLFIKLAQLEDKRR